MQGTVLPAMPSDFPVALSFLRLPTEWSLFSCNFFMSGDVFMRRGCKSGEEGGEELSIGLAVEHRFRLLDLRFL